MQSVLEYPILLNLVYYQYYFLTVRSICMVCDQVHYIH